MRVSPASRNWWNARSRSSEPVAVAAGRPRRLSSPASSRRVDAMTKAVLGIIGGSGLYDLPGLEDLREVASTRPWGEPSDAVRRRPHRRHRRWCSCRATVAGHRMPPSEINYRANIDALKRRASRTWSRCRPCGSFKRGTAARHFRAGRPVHRPHLRARELVLRHGLRRACVDGAPGVPRAAATIVAARAPRPRASPSRAAAPMSCMEGPQFSTLAEIA